MKGVSAGTPAGRLCRLLAWITVLTVAPAAEAPVYELKGLDPGLAPLLFEMAHDAGLRITAHIDTGPDLHYGVAAGVDEIAHMPGRRLNSTTVKSQKT